MKVYTKTGDKGKTSLFGGKRVLKNDVQIESYGNVDELNSWVGMLRDCSMSLVEKSFLIEVQETLFTIGSYLATDAEKKEKLKLPELHETMISDLELEMDKMDEDLPAMQDPDIDFAKRYINRLSDYLFVLSRKWAVDFKADEIPWKPKK